MIRVRFGRYSFALGCCKRGHILFRFKERGKILSVVLEFSVLPRLSLCFQRHLVDLLEQCAKNLERAERYEVMGEVFTLAFPIYEQERDFRVRRVVHWWCACCIFWLSLKLLQGHLQIPDFLRILLTLTSKFHQGTN